MLLLVSLVALTPSLAFAHSGDVTDESPGIEMMQVMEDHMMGDAQHERMEELMDRLFEGDLTVEEQQEMIQIMQDPEAGPGAMTMMMRTTNPQWSTWHGNGMMGLGTNPSVYWITVILVWTLIISGIIAIWRWLSKK